MNRSTAPATRISGTGVLGVVLALALLLGACTSDALPEPVEVDTCEGLVDVGVVYVERMFEELEELPVEAVAGNEPPPEDIAELTELGRELDLSAARLGCDPNVINAAVIEETADLTSDKPVVLIFLDVVRGGVVGTLPPPPVVTTTTEG